MPAPPTLSLAVAQAMTQPTGTLLCQKCSHLTFFSVLALCCPCLGICAQRCKLMQQWPCRAKQLRVWLAPHRTRQYKAAVRWQYSGCAAVQPAVQRCTAFVLRVVCRRCSLLLASCGVPSSTYVVLRPHSTMLFYIVMSVSVLPCDIVTGLCCFA